MRQFTVGLIALLILMSTAVSQARAQNRFRFKSPGKAAVDALENNTQVGKALLLFGGRDHDEFLGCLNCGPVDSNSVCNPVGRYGSPVASSSIWNPVGRYGSQVASTSPWNPVTTSSPVIVDGDGNFYGHFTTNRVKSNRTTIPAYVTFLDRMADAGSSDLNLAQRFFCG